MRYRLFILSALLLSFFYLKGLNAQNMYVNEKNGTQTTFSINEIRKLTFANDNIDINKNDNSTESFALVDIQHINFINTNNVNEEYMERNSFLLFPNPANNIVNIHCNNLDKEAVKVEVYNSKGIMVLQELIFQNNETIQINISNLNAGIYFIHFNNNDIIETKRLFKLNN